MNTIFFSICAFIICIQESTELVLKEKIFYKVHNILTFRSRCLCRKNLQENFNLDYLVKFIVLNIKDN